MPGYSASKAGQVGLTHSIAKEMAPHGIRVNAVAPGLTDTPMARTHPEEVARHIGTIPMGRAGTAEEVAELCAFLVSDKSPYITASVFDINGALQTAMGKTQISS